MAVAGAPLGMPVMASGVISHTGNSHLLAPTPAIIGGAGGSVMGVASLLLAATLMVSPALAGPLDTAFSWARADRLPIDVNLPWLPCKCDNANARNYVVV